MAAYSRREHPSQPWTLHEGDLYFGGAGRVHGTLKAIAKRLDELKIPYAVVGGLALFQHGFRRFTEDVDLLVRKDDLRRLHEELEGKGYRPKFTGSKNLRDTRYDVSIEFLISGEFPGDGKEKPVSFPDPLDESIVIDGVRYVNLKTLVELKLASGMSTPDRLKDIADVQQLISILRLGEDFSSRLDEFVREAYASVWRSVHAPKRFVRVLDYPLSSDAEGIAEQMRSEGIAEENDSEAGALRFVTEDTDLAARFDMHDESEFF